MKMINSVRSLMVAVFLKQITHYRKIAKKRDFGNGRAVLLLENSSQHDRASVFDQNLRLNVFRIDRRAGGCLLPARVLVDLDVHEDRTLGRDLWSHFKLQHRFTKRDRCGTARCRLLIGNLGSLFDSRLDLVGGHDTGAGNDLASTIRFESIGVQG